MTPEERKTAALIKRREQLLNDWKDKPRPQSPACETCGQAKTGPVPKVKNG